MSNPTAMAALSLGVVALFAALLDCGRGIRAVQADGESRDAFDAQGLTVPLPGSVPAESASSPRRVASTSRNAAATSGTADGRLHPP